MYGDEIGHDEKDAAGVVTRRQEFAAFECPSDDRSTQRLFIGNNPATAEALQISTYDDIGTSYHFNIGFFISMNGQSGLGGSAWLADLDKMMRSGIRETRGAIAGRFALYWEDPMDFGLFKRTQRMGFHKVFSRHSIGFLDGHAANLRADTRSWGGPGWVAINPNWVARPGQPLPPRHYVPIVGGMSTKNDEPPP